MSTNKSSIGGSLAVVGIIIVAAIALFNNSHAPTTATAPAATAQQETGTDLRCKFSDGSRGAWNFATEYSARSFAESLKVGNPIIGVGPAECRVTRVGRDDPNPPMTDAELRRLQSR